MDTSKQFVYKVREVVRVVDGDTFYLILDLGFRTSIEDSFRLIGFDTPELRGGSKYEREQSRLAKIATEEFLESENLWITSHKSDVYGRWLADVWTEEADGVVRTLGDHLVNQKLASIWPMKWREVYDTKERDLNEDTLED